MERKKKKIYKILIPVIVVLAYVIVFLIGQFGVKTKNGIKVTASKEYTVKNAVIYRQTDSQWAKEKIGPTGYTMKGSGDEICCIASVVTMVGVPNTPSDINKILTENNCINGDANVIWENLSVIRGYNVDSFDKVSSKNIDECLEVGKYPIVEVRTNKYGGMHSVLIVGTEDGEYTCMDPLKKELTHLSSYGNLCYSMRSVWIDGSLKADILAAEEEQRKIAEKKAKKAEEKRLRRTAITTLRYYSNSGNAFKISSDGKKLEVLSLDGEVVETLDLSKAIKGKNSYSVVNASDTEVLILADTGSVAEGSSVNEYEIWSVPVSVSESASENATESAVDEEEDAEENAEGNAQIASDKASLILSDAYIKLLYADDVVISYLSNGIYKEFDRSTGENITIDGGSETSYTLPRYTRADFNRETDRSYQKLLLAKDNGSTGFPDGLYLHKAGSKSVTYLCPYYVTGECSIKSVLKGSHIYYTGSHNNTYDTYQIYNIYDVDTDAGTDNLMVSKESIEEVQEFDYIEAFYTVSDKLYVLLNVDGDKVFLKYYLKEDRLEKCDKLNEFIDKYSPVSIKISSKKCMIKLSDGKYKYYDLNKNKEFKK
ncbi:MAG: hypothetical protein K6F77_05590 [Lachnospiraceae bacterium]|nr:hypothetical protein [Lachnospiraceae bacterium]